MKRLKRKLKQIRIKLHIRKRIILCRNVYSDNYLRCLNCRRFQSCHRQFLKRIRKIYQDLDTLVFIPMEEDLEICNHISTNAQHVNL